ncbi:Flagellar motor switch protein FliM [Buchnera aphidicola (Anoecia corni)]|uniref:Flagellar motor switch protein FliM n=1 Tax=Buchnera aphidicola (Anoecia corni) TaxID=2994477 RepID=A0AAT9IHP3_9GAMM
MKKNKKKTIEILFYPKNKEFIYYNKFIDCYMIKNTIILLDKIHLLFLNKIQQSLKKIFDSEINVQLNKVEVHTDDRLITSLNPKRSINKIKLENDLGIVFLSFPLKITTLMINSLLKNDYAYSENCNTPRKLTKAHVFMQKKFLLIVKEAYEYSWKNFYHSIEQQFFSKNAHKTLYYPPHNEKQKLQINIIFNLTLNYTQIKLSIIIPYYTFKNINNYLSFKKQKQLINSNISNINILSMLKNVNLNLSIRSIENLIPLNTVKNISIGDIIPINNPEKVIVQTEKVPIFSGNYGIKNEKIVIQVTHIIKKQKYKN